MTTIVRTLIYVGPRSGRKSQLIIEDILCIFLLMYGAKDIFPLIGLLLLLVDLMKENKR